MNPEYGKLCSRGQNCDQAPVYRTNKIGYPIFFIGEKYLGDAIEGPQFFPLYFLINLIIYYFVSCLIYGIYEKIRIKQKWQ